MCIRDRCYIADLDHKIHIYTLSGVGQGVWGSFGSGDAQFNVPSGIFIYKDKIYVTDGGNYRVQIFTLTGTFVDKWSVDILDQPWGIHII